MFTSDSELRSWLRHNLAVPIEHYSAYEGELGRFTMQCLSAREAGKREAIKFKVRYSEGRKLFDMTPQEQLFAEFFNKEIELVKDMELLELRAHREKMAQIAFQARARLGADDEMIREKEKKANGKKLEGFKRSVNIDDISSDAINKINERRKNMTKAEKLEEKLRQSGLPEEYVRKLMSNEKLHESLQEDVKKEAKEKLDKTIEKEKTEAAEKKKEIETKPFVNPFLKLKKTEDSNNGNKE